MKIKNLSFINGKLYLDALKQLRLIGFICFGILSIFSVLIPIGTAINTYNSTFYDHASNVAIYVAPILVTTRESFFAMFFIFVLFTPLLTIYLFSFLTKRNACDYFHSFPQRRGCLYNTYFAAVTTWIFIFTFGTALISGITYGILSKYFVFSYLNLVKYSISIFLVSSCSDSFGMLHNWYHIYKYRCIWVNTFLTTINYSNYGKYNYIKSKYISSKQDSTSSGL